MGFLKAIGLGAFARGGNTGVLGNPAEVAATRGQAPPAFSVPEPGMPPNLFDPATGMVGGQPPPDYGVPMQGPPPGQWQHPAEVMAQHMAASQPSPAGHLNFQPAVGQPYGPFAPYGMLPLGFYGRGPGSWGAPARGLGFGAANASPWAPPTPGLLGARY